ncbi:MAG: hypothetical protein ABI696_17785, partial [Rubrivivax sp.]
MEEWGAKNRQVGGRRAEVRRHREDGTMPATNAHQHRNSSEGTSTQMTPDPTESSRRATAALARPDSVHDEDELVMRVMPMPADSNANGDIFGGWIMAQVDVAGAVLPVRVAKGRVATVAVNQFVFKQP